MQGFNHLKYCRLCSEHISQAYRRFHSYSFSSLVCCLPTTTIGLRPQRARLRLLEGCCYLYLYSFSYRLSQIAECSLALSIPRSCYCEHVYLQSCWVSSIVDFSLSLARVATIRHPYDQSKMVSPVH